MQRDPKSYLWDVREAADAIVSFIEGMNDEQYAATPLVHSAVERKFEIIGEALNGLSKADAAIASRIPDLQRIIAFRNLLIHGYAAVEHGRVWQITREYLPLLRKTVDELLAELETQGGSTTPKS
jgi:uncharacterized protein with HEPN domain